MQRIKTYLKSECSSTTKSSESRFRIVKKKKSLDPMNANINLLTFNYIKKSFCTERKGFRFADIGCRGCSRGSVLATEQPNRGKRYIPVLF